MTDKYLSVCTPVSPIYDEEYLKYLSRSVKAAGLEHVIDDDHADSFAELRNILANNARTPVVLMLDADEFMPPSDLMYLKRIARMNPMKVIGFKRYNYWESARKVRVDGTWYPDTQFRMYPRDYCRWEGKLHESLTMNSTMQRVILSDIHIHHLGWLRGEEVLKKKEDRYDEIMGKKRPLRLDPPELELKEIRELKLI